MKTQKKDNESRRNILKKTAMAVPTIITFTVSELKAEGSGHQVRVRHRPPQRPQRPGR